LPAPEYSKKTVHCTLSKFIFLSGLQIKRHLHTIQDSFRKLLLNQFGNLAQLCKTGWRCCRRRQEVVSHPWAVTSRTRAPAPTLSSTISRRPWRKKRSGVYTIKLKNLEKELIVDKLVKLVFIASIMLSKYKVRSLFLFIPNWKTFWSVIQHRRFVNNAVTWYHVPSKNLLSTKEKDWNVQPNQSLKDHLEITTTCLQRPLFWSPNLSLT
jgi:hypothetical protein